MISALERTMPPRTCWTRPSGGLFLWLQFPPGIDARRLLEACIDANVAFVPGGAFFPNGGHNNTARLNFSNMPEDRIAEGIGRIAETLPTVEKATSRRPAAAVATSLH